MQRCMNKKQLRCIYLTKDNYEELLKLDCPNYKDDECFALEITDKEVMVHTIGSPCSERYLFGWWVEEEREYGHHWVSYTDEDFNSRYNLVVEP